MLYPRPLERCVAKSQPVFGITSREGCAVTVSGGFDTLTILVSKLELNLPGTILLLEHDGQWKRIMDWFWNYGLTFRTVNDVYIAYHVTDTAGGDIDYWIADGSTATFVSGKSLRMKWSGWLFIQKYRVSLLNKWWNKTCRLIRDLWII